MPLIVEDLEFSYGPRKILNRFSLELHERQMVALMGPSGTGKSTLLGLLVGHLTPAHGTITYPSSLVRNGVLERKRIAWIMQSANIFGRRTALENVMLPLRLSAVSKSEQVRRATDALELVNLTERKHDRGAKLSGGEKQRVAVARAIAVQSSLLIADEPTVALDRANRESLIAALKQSAHAGAIVLIATHDPEVAEACDLVVNLQ